MSMQDPLADMFTRIRNGQSARMKWVSIPYSRFKEDIVKVLHSEGYIREYEVRGEGATKTLSINLKYYRGKPVIEEIKRISRPGLRRYFKVGGLTPIRSGLGISIVSTSKGVLADRQARQQRVGGELICTVF